MQTSCVVDDAWSGGGGSYRGLYDGIGCFHGLIIIVAQCRREDVEAFWGDGVELWRQGF